MGLLVVLLPKSGEAAIERRKIVHGLMRTSTGTMASGTVSWARATDVSRGSLISIYFGLFFCLPLSLGTCQSRRLGVGKIATQGEGEMNE